MMDKLENITSPKPSDLILLNLLSMYHLFDQGNEIMLINQSSEQLEQSLLPPPWAVFRYDENEYKRRKKKYINLNFDDTTTLISAGLHFLNHSPPTPAYYSIPSFNP